MKTKLFISLLLIFFPVILFSQWPGYFYAFELKDAEGNTIDSSSHNYTMSTVVCDGCGNEIILGIRICEDNKTWRFYAGGNYKFLDKPNSLRIDKMKNGEIAETMTIEFPASLSIGKDKYYHNLYAGTITFKNGNHTVTIPGTENQWNELKEMKLCPDGINNYSFHDISNLQK